MFDIRLYNLTKKTNSTKQPTGTGTAFSCNVKTMSSLMRPVVQITSGSSLVSYNYAYIAEFNRYYFINDITWNSGFWELSLTCDVLATYKSDIGDTTMYLLRSANNSNGYLVDNMWEVTGKYTTSLQEVIPLINTTFQSGYYVLNVIGQGNSAGTTSYQLTPAQMTSLMSGLYTTADGYDWGDFTKGFVNSMFNPEEKIVSCLWFPTSFSTSGNSNITLGLWDSGVSGSKIANSQSALTVSFTVPKHPQASSYGKYCNLAPYSEYILSLGFCQAVKLDTTMLVDASTIEVVIDRDYLTGMATIIGTAYNSSNSEVGVLFNMSAQYGVPVNLAAGKNNLAGVVGNIAALGVGIATGGASTALTVGAAVGITSDAIRGAAGTLSNNVGVGNITGHRQSRYLKCRFFEIAPRDAANMGLPCCKNLKPSAVNGYMIAAKGDIDIANATAAERDAVAGFLTTGFYYE